jgi:hypothetical protein
MSKSIINYQEGRREFLTSLYEKNILDLSTLENKDQAIFFAALGCERPTEIKKKDGSGWFRVDGSVDDSAIDQAMISCFLLGRATSDEEVEKYTEKENFYDYFERCAEGGFQIFEQKVKDAEWDNEVLVRRMLKDLDLAYTTNVENDI